MPKVIAYFPVTDEQRRVVEALNAEKARKIFPSWLYLDTQFVEGTVYPKPRRSWWQRLLMGGRW